MTTPDLIKDFVAKLRNRLCKEPHLAERMTAEAEDHLVESAQSLQSQGLSVEDAEREAIARFGDPENIARTFEIDLRSEPGMWLRKLSFNIVICYAAVSFVHLVNQLPGLLLITTTGGRLSRLEFQAGLLTVIPEVLRPSSFTNWLYQFWFVLHPAVIIVLGLSVLHFGGERFKSFLTYLVVYSSVFLVLVYLKFFAWDGGDFERWICSAFPSVCPSMPGLRLVVGVVGGGLLLVANAIALRSVLRETPENWMSQWVALAVWILPIGFITGVIFTWFSPRWNDVAEAILTITFLVLMLSGLPAVLLSRAHRAVP